MRAEGDFRKLAQHLRQTTRAQLMEMRQARMQDAVPADMPKADNAITRQERRQRRMERQAQLTRRAEDARLAAGLQAGTIELWDAPSVAQPEVLEYFGPVWSPVPIEAVEPVLEYFGPPWDPTLVPLDDAPLGEFFGPVWSPMDLLVLAADELSGGATLPAEDDSPIRDGLKLFSGLKIGATGAVDVGEDDAAMLVPLVESAGVEAFDFSTFTLPHMPASRDPVCDLTALPGSGPALIWMLEKCGIASLAELAEANMTTLVPRMGLVGQIVDVPAWQRFARRLVEGAKAAAAG